MGLRAGRLPSPGRSLAALILLWCLYHLLQYLGIVALWSWLADVAPPRIRGRFLGWRERWLVVGQAAAAIDAGLFVWGAGGLYPRLPGWIPYALATGLGAAFMIASLAPLLLMPSANAALSPLSRRERVPASSPLSRRERVRVRASCERVARHDSPIAKPIATQPSPPAPLPKGEGSRTGSLLQPFTDARFLRLLLFGCWFSFFNGVTQSAQNYYPMQVLGISLFLSLTLQTGMRLGQSGVSPWVGRLADRLGNRPVMMLSQLLVAAGLLFFAAATPDHWTWLIGAWALWIAYAGMNVCLPNLMLKLSPERSDAPYIAAFYAVTGLCYGASTIVGGALVDQYRTWQFPLGGDRWLLFFPCIFISGWAARSLGALVLFWVVEPPVHSERPPP